MNKYNLKGFWRSNKMPYWISRIVKWFSYKNIYICIIYKYISGEQKSLPIPRGGVTLAQTQTRQQVWVSSLLAWWPPRLFSLLWTDTSWLLSSLKDLVMFQLYLALTSMWLNFQDFFTCNIYLSLQLYPQDLPPHLISDVLPELASVRSVRVA